MSERRSILATSVLVTLATVGVGLVSFVNQTLIARLFGTGPTLEAYQIAANAPATVVGVVVAALMYGMVPLLVRRRLEDPEVRGFAGAMLLRVLAASVALSLVGMALSGPLIDALGRDLDAPMRDLAHRVAPVAWASVVPLVGLAQLSAMHDSAHRFLVTVLGGAGPYVGMIAGGLLLGRSLGVLAIAWGLLAGAVGGVAILVVGVRAELGFGAVSEGHRLALRAFFGTVPAALVSVLIFTSFQFIDSFWGPRVDAAALPTLGYGQRLLIAFGALVTSGPLAVIVPRLAKAVTEGRHADFRDDAARALRLVLSFGGFVAVAVSALAGPTVALLFQRGAFDAAATARVAGVMPWMMAGMVPMLAVSLLFRGFYARNWLRSTMALSLGTVGGYFVLSGLLGRPFGASGIAAGYALAWTLALAAAMPMLWREDRRELVSAPNRRFALCLLASLAGVLAATALPARLLLGDYEALGKPALALRLALCGAAGLAAFYLLAVRLFGMEGPAQVFGFFGRLMRRRSPRNAAGVQ